MFSSARALVVALAASAVCSAGPTPLDARVIRPLNELAVRDPMEIARSQYLEKRISADFGLENEWNNEVLFGGTWIDAGENDAESVALEVVCIECWTKGTVTAKLTTEDIIKPIVRLEFDGTEAYFNLGIKASAGATYAINLFNSNDALGLGLPGLSLGLIFHVDLVFSLSAQIDLTGGFYVKVAEGSFLETDVFTGDITDHLFDGIGTKSIPVEVHAGSATFKAALRLRVQCGAEADFDLIGIGAGAVVGIYANIVEFVAILDSTPTCALQTREFFDMNVGAFAKLNVVVDFKTIGLVPTVSTTLLNSPTWTQCWIDGSPGETGGADAPTTSRPPQLPHEPSFPEPSAPATIVTAIIPTAGSAGNPGKETASADAAKPSTFKYPIANSSSPAEEGYVTSTVYATQVYTITSCAAEVVNCPASWQKEIIVTRTVDAFTTICPADAEITFPSSAATAAATGYAPVHAAVTVVKEVVVLLPCETPEVGTFVAPTTRQPPAEHTLTYEEPLATTLAFPEVKDDVPSKNGTASHTGAAKPQAPPSGTGNPARPTAVTAAAGRIEASWLLFGIVTTLSLPIAWVAVL